MPNTLSTSIHINVDNLGKRFNRDWIFKNLTFSFQAGNTYAITGPNGSGKSTLLQTLWGQMPPSIGSLKYINGEKEIQPEEIFKHLTIATPYQDLIDEFTLQEQLEFHFKLKSARNGITVDDALERMYLKHARHKYISNFSSGMRQRVKLALAFYTAADIIFLDEPGTNLDQQAFEWYQSNLNQLPASCLVFIASNNPDEYSSSTSCINIMDYK